MKTLVAACLAGAAAGALAQVLPQVTVTATRSEASPFDVPASVDVIDATLAPTVSLTDDEARIVISRLGARLRIAGTAELSGYSTELNPVRCEALTRRMMALFPGAAEYGKATFWAGLRPSTPSNVPIIGASPIGGLYLNTGHGTLGWTLACGSGQALADIMSGRKPGVRFRFT